MTTEASLLQAVIENPQMDIPTLLQMMERYVSVIPDGDLTLGWRLRLWSLMRRTFPEQAHSRRCALALSAGSRLRIPARQGTRRTEADIVVTVRRLVPVAVGAADVPRLIVERAATQHPSARPSPSGNGLYRRERSAGDSGEPVEGDWNSHPVYTDSGLAMLGRLSPGVRQHRGVTLTQWKGTVLWPPLPVFARTTRSCESLTDWGISRLQQVPARDRSRRMRSRRCSPGWQRWATRSHSSTSRKDASADPN